MQIVVANVVPCVFGAITGIMLGVNEIAYLALAGPIGILGGYFAGLEHRSAPEGAARGAIGGSSSAPSSSWPMRCREWTARRISRTRRSCSSS